MIDIDLEKSLDPQTKWDLRFLEAAMLFAGWSKDPSTQTGSVIVDANRSILGQGFNGFPRGVKDDEELYANREVKYKRIIHAEINALILGKGPFTNATCYVWPFMPCSRCAVLLIQAGITRVVSLESDNERWLDEWRYARDLFDEAGVALDLYPIYSLYSEDEKLMMGVRE